MGQQQTMLKTAALVRTKGSAEEPAVVEVRSLPAGRLTSSFQAEMVAIREALRQIENEVELEICRIVTDSRSAVDRLTSLTKSNTPRSACEDTIMQLLETLAERGKKGLVCWCPSHSDVPGMSWPIGLQPTVA